MSSSQTPYTLTAQQLDAALAALAKASDTFRLSPLERGLSRVLTVCTTLFVLGIATGIALLQMDGMGCPAGISILIGIAAGLVAPVVLLANFGFVVKTLRQRKLVKQLGLREISYSAWKARRKRQLFVRIGGALLTILGVALLIATVLFGWSIRSAEHIAFLLFLVAIAATPVVWRLVQRSRQQLAVIDDAASLRAILTSMHADAEDKIVVPAAVLEKVAGIERAQIARERARAVLDGMSDAKRGYGVLIAKEVAEQKAALPSDRRLEVEDLIDELTAESYPSAAGLREGGAVLSARTPDGSAEIDYSVDERNRRIHVVGLRTLDGHVL